MAELIGHSIYSIPWRVHLILWHAVPLLFPHDYKLEIEINLKGKIFTLRPQKRHRQTDKHQTDL